MLGFSAADVKFIAVFFKMNVRDKYLGTALGLAWAVLNPLFMLGLYTFVFGYVYKSKSPGASTTLSYAIWMISGFGPWMAMTEGLSAATMSVVSNAGLFKNVNFKSEALPLAYSLNGLISLTVCFGFLGVMMAIDGNLPTWHWIFIFPLIVLQFYLAMGIGLFFSAIQVFIRDFGVMLPNLLTVVLFATPIFYPITVFPARFQSVAYFNPVFAISNGYRSALLEHRAPDWDNLLPTALLSVVLFLTGLKFFRRLKGHFEAML